MASFIIVIMQPQHINSITGALTCLPCKGFKAYRAFIKRGPSCSLDFSRTKDTFASSTFNFTFKPSIKDWDKSWQLLPIPFTIKVVSHLT
jgi:hypothetical protein